MCQCSIYFHFLCNGLGSLNVNISVYWMLLVAFRHPEQGILLFFQTLSVFKESCCFSCFQIRGPQMTLNTAGGHWTYQFCKKWSSVVFSVSIPGPVWINLKTYWPNIYRTQVSLVRSMGRGGTKSWFSNVQVNSIVVPIYKTREKRNFEFDVHLKSPHLTWSFAFFCWKLL